MASVFPINETVSFEALSSACGLNVIDTRRMVRHAMSNHIFQERDGKVAHTAASRVLAEDDRVKDIVGLMCEELFQGSAKVIDNDSLPSHHRILSFYRLTRAFLRPLTP